MVSSEKAGNYEPGAIVYTIKKGSGAIAMGDLLRNSAGVFDTSPASAGTTGPFAVAIKAALAGDDKVAAIHRGIVYLTADAAINPGAYVQPASGTVGRVITFAASTVSSTPTQAEVQNVANDCRRVVGVYLGHVDENDGKTTPTAAAQGDIIRVKFQ